jgi:hypothetical protein
MSLLRVLASGVDGLEVTARGGVRPEVWGLLERAKLEAQEAGKAMPFEFPRASPRFLILPRGRRAWSYWLTSPDCELALGRNPQGVTAYAQLHSAYLHERGPELAVGMVGTLLQANVMAGPFQLIGSRVDVYADVQGWAFNLTDLERFASRGRFREAFPVSDEGSAEVFMAGRRVTGFRFGRDAVVARVYDKTADIRRRPVSWLPEVWGERDETLPVWRVEFQLRRRAIAEFRVTEFDEVLASAQDFWRHCTEEWLTLRVRRRNRQRARWPVDPSWVEVQQITVAPRATGVVRRRLAEANEEMLVRKLQGYLTSWAAVRGHEELRPTLWALESRVTRYLMGRDRTFRDEARGKRARLLGLSLDEAPSRARPRRLTDGYSPSGQGQLQQQQGAQPHSQPQQEHMSITSSASIHRATSIGVDGGAVVDARQRMVAGRAVGTRRRQPDGGR